MAIICQVSILSQPLRRSESQYLTDYFVWGNYETPKLDYQEVNSSDFSALLLEINFKSITCCYALLT